MNIMHVLFTSTTNTIVYTITFLNSRSIRASRNDNGVRSVIVEKSQNEIDRPETCRKTITVGGDRRYVGWKQRDFHVRPLRTNKPCDAFAGGLRFPAKRIKFISVRKYYGTQTMFGC